MKLKTDWILQEPIDLEHKQYILLDYISKVNKDFEEFKIYPTFQELTLHVANINQIKDKGSYLILNREPEDIDDEILIEDISYNKIFSTKENILEIMKIANYSLEKFSELFIIGKSMWSLINDSVSIKPIHNKGKIIEKKPGIGFFYIHYSGELYIFQYELRRIKQSSLENKCKTIEIYRGEEIVDISRDDIINLIQEHHKLNNDKESSNELIESTLPIFEVTYQQEFPLYGGILSLAKRKVMNYVFQTIKIDEIKIR